MALLCQSAWERHVTKANSQGGNAAEILCLRRLGVWGKSVAHMRECPRPLVEVGIELSGMEPVCVVTCLSQADVRVSIEK